MHLTELIEQWIKIHNRQQTQLHLVTETEIKNTNGYALPSWQQHRAANYYSWQNRLAVNQMRTICWYVLKYLTEVGMEFFLVQSIYE